MPEKKEKECIVCGKPLSARRKKYCSDACGKAAKKQKVKDGIDEKDVPAKPKAVAKPKTRAHLLCEEAMELAKDRLHLRLRISGDGFTLINAQPQPWGYTMKGGYTEPELVALVKRIKDTPTRG